MYSVKEMHNLSLAELLRELQEHQAEYLKCRIEVKTNSRKDTHRLKLLRRYIARLHTFITRDKTGVSK